MKSPNSFSKYFAIIVLFLILGLKAFSQHVLIPTGTTTKIREVRKYGNMVVLNGNYDYVAKCYGDCDQLITLQTPSPANYFNRNLNIIDTNRFYISSLLGVFPYHAIVFKTVDGGQNWTSVLDTVSDEFFTEGLVVFDTNTIVLLSSQGRTFVTGNGGDTWEIGAQTGMPTTSGLQKINDSTAIIGVLERLRITTNKGNSWVGSSFLQANPNTFSAKTLDSIYSVSVGPSGAYFSYIFGQPPFDRVDKLIPMMEPAGLYVVSKDEIYITGKGWPQEVGRILKTTDLGNSWLYYDIPETEKLLELVFLDDSIALIGGYNGTLVKWNKNSLMTEWGLGLTESAESIEVAAYPNPVTQEQFVEVNTVPGEKLEIRLYDQQGRLCELVYSGLTDADKKSISMDLSHLDSGLYVYYFQMGDRIGQLRFVKE